MMQASGEVYRLWTESFSDANTLTVEVGTNCPRGGDAGHGGSTSLRLIDDGGTAMYYSVNGAEDVVEVRDIMLLFRGDAECKTLIDALAFALRTLRRQVKENGK